MINIDLYAKRDYSGTQRLAYDVAGNSQKLCGDAGHWPSVAGKVMLKWR